MAKKTRDEVRIEALGAIRKHRKAGAAVSMGVGKTRLGLEHFQLVMNKVTRDELRDAKALVVAPTKVIIQGWSEEAEKWDMQDLLENIDFTTYRSLIKQDMSQYDVVYLDECHSLKLSHNNALATFPGYIIGLTGTPPKYKSSTKYKLVNKFCPIVYEYITDDAVEAGILNDYRIKVHLLELDENPNSFKVEIKNKAGVVSKSWYTSERENYDYWTARVNNAYTPKDIQTSSIMRMKAMQVYKSKDDYAKKLLDQATEKCILFANEQRQADKLCKYSYHSNNKDSELNMEKFEAGEIDKLSCVLQLSVGANIKGLKECIIMHAYGNNRKAAQRIGRMLRLNPDETANIHILCYKDTIDEKWVDEALAEFDQNKVSYYDATIF